MTDTTTPATTGTTSSPSETLGPDAIAFAHRMFDAARHGDPVLLSALSAGLPVNLTNDEGNTLLMLAAYNGHGSLVAELLARGAAPDRVNDRGQSPLAGVVFKGYDEIARVLIEKGASPDVGRPSARETARMFGREGVLGLMGEPKEGEGQETQGQ